LIRAKPRPVRTGLELRINLSFFVRETTPRSSENIRQGGVIPRLEAGVNLVKLM